MSPNIHAQRILILDFGSQYTQLIARRIREIGVYSELHSCDMPAEDIAAFAPTGIILSGGPETVTDVKTPRAPGIVFDLGCPVLGICYGMQTMAAQLGGEVETCTHREFGYAEAKVVGGSRLLEGIEDRVLENGEALLDVWMSHGDRVKTLPAGFKLIVNTPNTPIAGMADENRRFYALLFHPEVTHSRQGTRILERFVRDICGCSAQWTASNIIAEAIDNIREQVGKDNVILALSGGVDSSVVAALLHRALGQQVTNVFVNTGLMREAEDEQIMNMFAKRMGAKVICIDAERRFLNALAGVIEPEQKRKIIGKLFIDIFEEQAAKLENVKWLAQGTIYTDVIESANTKSGKAHLIKSHHNVGGLPTAMKLQLIEPLRELFKDEVCELGLELGLPYEMVHRHPFPGPGLGVRILGEVKQEYANILRQADAIFVEELHRHDLYHKIKQAFAVFLPVKSVGVIGDARQYSYVIALRAVETIDFMTARWAHLPYEVLEKISNRIINEVRGVSRVVYDISGKPPATIEWE
jgi:GMP synthase (glutamine-hydrolysing)